MLTLYGIEHAFGVEIIGIHEYGLTGEYGLARTFIRQLLLLVVGGVHVTQETWPDCRQPPWWWHLFLLGLPVGYA